MSVSSKKSLAQADEEMDKAFLASARDDHVIDSFSRRASTKNKKQEMKSLFVGLDEIQSDGEEAYQPQSPPPPAPRESSEQKVQKARLMAQSYIAAMKRARDCRLELQEASDNICDAWGQYEAPLYERGPTAIVTNTSRGYNIIEQLRYEKAERERERKGQYEAPLYEKTSDDGPFLVNKVVGPTAIVTNTSRGYNIIEQLRYEKEERERERKGQYEAPLYEKTSDDVPFLVNKVVGPTAIVTNSRRGYNIIEQLRYEKEQREREERQYNPHYGNVQTFDIFR